MRRNAGRIRNAMSTPPRLRRSRRISPPRLADDNMREIFVRLQQDDLAGLVRAGAGCKNWRRILSDDAFASRYLEFHGAQPMLGFFHSDTDDMDCVSHFVSTGSSSSSPPGCGDHDDWFILDSRHGRVLFWTPKDAEKDFVVLDPMTDDQWEIPANPRYSAELFNAEGDEQVSLTWNAALVCSNNGCDHHDCRGGHFLVVLVGADDAEWTTFAAVYSSESGEWSEMISVEEPEAINEEGHSVFLKNKLYFPCARTDTIVEYDVGGQELQVIDTGRKHLVLASAAGDGPDGMLLFADVRWSKLHVCSMEIMEAGAVAWSQSRIIELKQLLPSGTSTLSHASVIGAVEGAGIIFLYTADGLFMIDLNSGLCKKAYKKKKKKFFLKIIPYTSFYTAVHRELPGH